MLENEISSEQELFVGPDGEVVVRRPGLPTPIRTPISIIRPPGGIGDPPIFVPVGVSVAGFTPASGARGTQVAINGSGFLGTQSVRFGGAESRAFTVAADNQILAQVPPDAVTGPVTVSGPNGSATSFTSFVVLASSPLPIVDSFFPLSGPAGTRITISGSNLQPASQVLFNGTPAFFVINTSTQIVVDVPPGATSGRITVMTPAGSATSQGIFVVIQPSQLPAISGFSPTSGPAGTTVDILGNNFLDTREVRFNGLPSNNVTVASIGEIRAQAPAGAGTGPITVITGAGSVTSSGSFSVLAVSPLPAISFFNPISGQAGATVVITGTQLGTATAVKFNGKPAAGFTVQSATQISAMVPLGASSGPVTVTTPSGTASSSVPFTVLPGTVPGTRSLRHRTTGTQPQSPSEVVGVILRAGGNVFPDEFVAERVISGIRILDTVQLSVSGKIPKGTISVQPTLVQTYTDVVKVMLQAGVATPLAHYTVEIHGKSTIDGEEYDPIRYEIEIDPAVLINVDPSSAGVRAGKSTTFNVTLDRSAGAAGLPVTLSTVDLPAGATDKYGQSPTSGTATSLKISTLQSTPVGKAPFRIRGAATFQGSPVELRDRKATLNVKEPRVRLLIDPTKQSQTVEAGQTADFPFTIVRNSFDKELTVELDRPSFATTAVQTPPNPIRGNDFTLSFGTPANLTVDLTSPPLNVTVKDGEGTVMASAMIQLSVRGALTVELEIQNKEDAQEVAGNPVQLDVTIRKSRPSPTLDLVVTNRDELAAKKIQVSVTPASTPGTMATLDIAISTSTPIGMYPIHLEARLDGRTVAMDDVTLTVLGRIKLALTDTNLSGFPGETLNTRLRVVERIGFPDPVPVGVDVDGVPVTPNVPDPNSPLQVVLGFDPVVDETPVSLTIGADQTSGALPTVGFFAKIDDPVQKSLLLTPIALAFVTVK
jgi:hypothetical protein